MKTVLIAIVICCWLFNEALCGVEDDWNDFKIKYKKTYEYKEEKKRFSDFKDNLKEIRHHNNRYEKGLESYKKGITVFADLSRIEFESKYQLDRPMMMTRYSQSWKNRYIDKNLTKVDVDWRKEGAVTPVKNQGICGSCWIFSAVGVLESYHFRKTGKLISLSEQNVVDCFSSNSCLGGLPEDALTFIQKNGVSTEAEYPYKDKQMACKPSSNKTRIDFKSYQYINEKEEELKNAVKENGPVSVGMYVDGRLRLYSEGVWYNKKCSDTENHAMVLVGYGTENGVDYWLIKNSWGTSWGEDGYMKVARGRHDNYCGLTGSSIYLT
ncbi:uncharacterized protein LOC126885881 [Diabrotica virgifera virgifera]|uniref:Zingipain-2-like n=1 Tax=Diabrotica virgifera virgifera TaxID=50390 RepID=A0A6P7G371_DIAVI|nr:uncharacterized protein LOC126885881 [Diabrotica virgifera virgifera]